MYKILHVEDDLDIVEIAKLALEFSGDFEVVQFSLPHEAIRHAAGVNPDVLLLDMMMPGLSGEQLLAKLREIPSLSKIPAIFMTARTQPHEVAALLANGASAVIEKPFDPMTLADRIKAIIESR